MDPSDQAPCDGKCSYSTIQGNVAMQIKHRQCSFRAPSCTHIYRQSGFHFSPSKPVAPPGPRVWTKMASKYIQKKVFVKRIRYREKERKRNRKQKEGGWLPCTTVSPAWYKAPIYYSRLISLVSSAASWYGATSS